MSILEKLATFHNRKEQDGNPDLADELIASKDTAAIKELADNIKNEDKHVQSDCLQVLYEIGEKGHPELISPYFDSFLELTQSENNRFVWGAMKALDMMALLTISEIFDNLSLIMSIIEKGSAMTVEHGVSILAKLTTKKEYYQTAFPLLIDQLEKCQAKQLPTFFERSEGAINKSNRKRFVEIFESRMNELEKDLQKERIKNVLKDED